MGTVNYNKYFVDGQQEVFEAQDYHSHNTERLTIPQIKDKLLSLQLVRDELAEWEANRGH